MSGDLRLLLSSWPAQPVEDCAGVCCARPSLRERSSSDTMGESLRDAGSEPDESLELGVKSGSNLGIGSFAEPFDAVLPAGEADIWFAYMRPRLDRCQSVSSALPRFAARHAIRTAASKASRGERAQEAGNRLTRQLTSGNRRPSCG